MNGVDAMPWRTLQALADEIGDAAPGRPRFVSQPTQRVLRKLDGNPDHSRHAGEGNTSLTDRQHLPGIVDSFLTLEPLELGVIEDRAVYLT